MRIYPSLDHVMFLQVEGSKEELDAAIQALTFIDKKKYQDYENAVRAGVHLDPPEPVCFYGLGDNRIFAGHLKYLLEKMKGIGRPVQVDLPSRPPITQEAKIKELQSLDYRYFQREAIEAGIKERVGIITASTGAGKSAIAAGLIASLGRPSLFIVPQVPLLQQMLGEFSRWGVPDLGVVGSGEMKPNVHTLADGRYLGRLLKSSSKKTRQWLRSIEVLVVDEAQMIPAASWTSTVLACPRAEYRLALSATPFTSAGGPETIRDFQLIGMFGEVIYEIGSSELKERGFIATPEIYILPVTNSLVKIRSSKSLYSMRQKGIEFNRVYKEGIVENDIRNSLAVQTIFILSKIHKMKVLIVVQHIEHGREILRRLHAMGISSSFVIGNSKVYHDPDEEPTKDPMSGFRSETVTRYIDGEIEALVVSPVFGVGYDMPGSSIDAGVLLAAGRGHRATLQRLGRTLRPRAGDNKVVIIDFFDEQHYYLKAQSVKRIQEYRAEGHVVLGKQAFHDRFLKEVYG